MDSKKIFLVRHGQTDFNLKGIVQGSGVDSSLNDTGNRQAKIFYSAYQNVRFQKVYTSALVRTHQSVKNFIDAGIPWQILSELNEISWGSHEGRAITPEEDKYYHWLLERWQQGETGLKIEGGESPDEVAGRLQKAINFILSQPEELILICMHGRAMRILLCLMLRYPLRNMDIFPHQNMGLYELIYSGSMFKILSHNYIGYQEKANELINP